MSFEVTIGPFGLEKLTMCLGRKVLALVGYFATNTTGCAAENEWMVVGSK